MALPVLAVGGILAVLVVVYVSRREKRTVWAALGAAAVLFAGLAITVAIHFPINHQIATWSPQAPSADWRPLLERWRAANTVRSMTAIVAFILLLIPTGHLHRSASLPIVLETRGLPLPRLVFDFSERRQIPQYEFARAPQREVERPRHAYGITCAQLLVIGVIPNIRAPAAM